MSTATPTAPIAPALEAPAGAEQIRPIGQPELGAGKVYEHQHATGEVVTATAEQAVARCPYLGKLPVEQAQMLLEVSAAGKQRMAEEATEAASNVAEDREVELAEGATEQVIEREPEAIPAITQLDRNNMAAAQEEAQQSQRLSEDSAATNRRLRFESKESPRRPADTDEIVRRVIAANPQACKAFINNEAGALDTLVSEAMKIRAYEG